MIAEIDDDRDVAYFTLIWAIKNYNELPCFSVHSPWFSGKLLENTLWSLSIVDEVDSGIPVACRIERGIDDKKGNVHINFNLEIIGADGLPLVAKSGEKCFEKFSRSEWLQLVDKIAILEHKGKFLPNDTLTLRCQLQEKNSSTPGTDISFARTVLGVEKREFFWSHKEFSQMQLEQKRSLLVQPLQMGVPKIELTLYLEQTSGEDNVLIEVKISDRKELHCVIAKISVVDADGRLSHTKGKGAIFIVEEDCLKFEPFVKKAELLKDESHYLINDILFLKCELKTSFGVVFSRLENYGYGLTTTVESALPAKSTSDLKSSEETSNSYTSCNSDGLSNLENGNDCSLNCCSLCPLNIALNRLQKGGEIPDLLLTNGSRSFHVHKSILVDKSPAFKKLIDENMTTKYFDLSTQYLHHILTYVYTGTVKY